MLQTSSLKVDTVVQLAKKFSRTPTFSKVLSFMLQTSSLSGQSSTLKSFILVHPYPFPYLFDSVKNELIERLFLAAQKKFYAN